MRHYADEMPEFMDKLAARFERGGFDEALGAVGIVIQEGIARNFAAQRGSTGGTWPDRKFEKDLPHPQLIETGALQAAATGTGPGSIRRVVNGRFVEVGVDKSVQSGGIPGAAVHNFGYPEKNIPQREWLYATTETLDEAKRVFAEQAIKEIFR